MTLRLLRPAPLSRLSRPLRLGQFRRFRTFRRACGRLRLFRLLRRLGPRSSSRSATRLWRCGRLYAGRWHHRPGDAAQIPARRQGWAIVRAAPTGRFQSGMDMSVQTALVQRAREGSDAAFSRLVADTSTGGARLPAPPGAQSGRCRRPGTGSLRDSLGQSRQVARRGQLPHLRLRYRLSQGAQRPPSFQPCRRP